MSARELKTVVHDQIEALTDEQTIQVYEYLSSQYGKELSTSEEMIAALRHDLETARVGGYKGITTNELQTKMRQWLTR